MLKNVCCAQGSASSFHIKTILSPSLPCSFPCGLCLPPTPTLWDHQCPGRASLQRNGIWNNWLGLKKLLSQKTKEKIWDILVERLKSHNQMQRRNFGSWNEKKIKNEIWGLTGKI